jgi:hypothetical protein
VVALPPGRVGQGVPLRQKEAQTVHDVPIGTAPFPLEERDSALTCPSELSKS